MGLVVSLKHQFVRAAKRARIQPRPSHADTQRIVRPMRHQAESGEAEAEIFFHREGLRIVQTKLPKGGNRSFLRPLAGRHSVLAIRSRTLGRTAPNTLAAEQVEPAGAVLRDTRWSVQHPGLIPCTRTEFTWIPFRGHPIHAGF